MEVTEQKILSSFNLSKESMVPLYQQLQEQFEGLIEKFPCGTRLPSERKLSEELGVDRGTIKKALKHFTKRGMIARQGSRGTFIRKDQISNQQFQIHPMALEKFDLKHSANELKMVLYENLVLEKDFWEKSVALFNSLNHDTRIDIEWLPQNVKRNDYAKYINDNSPDIIQTPVMPDFRELLAELPEDITATLQSGDYLNKCYNEADQEYLKKFVPIHFTPLVCACNYNIAGQIGMQDCGTELQNKGIRSVLKIAASKLPPGINVSGHIWDGAFAVGLPETLDQVDFDFFKRLFSAVSDCEDYPNMYLSRQEKRFEEIKMFTEARSMFLIIYSSYLFMTQRPQDFDFDFRMFFLSPEEGMIQAYNMVSSLGIYRDSQKKAEAAKFIRFMISEDIQKQVVNMFSAPFLRKAWEGFIRSGAIKDQEQAEKIISSYRFCPTGTNWHYVMTDHFIGFGMRDIFEHFADSKITIDEAAEQALTRFEQLKMTTIQNTSVHGQWETKIT